jgi:hypothetical protein
MSTESNIDGTTRGLNFKVASFVMLCGSRTDLSCSLSLLHGELSTLIPTPRLLTRLLYYTPPSTTILNPS